MKKSKRFTILLIALVMVFVTGQAVFAVNTPVDGGTFTYDGSETLKNEKADEDIDSQISSMQPGDSISFTFEYRNTTSDKTDWYMKNEVLKTLEEKSKATRGGGYTYTLVNYGITTGEVTIFDSDAVGGSEDAEGLKKATDATGEWFYIDTLDGNEGTGKTVLTVALDPESHVNTYMASEGSLSVEYGVEVENTEDIIKYVNTGDSSQLLLYAAMFLGSLILLILGFLHLRKDRKEGEEA